MFFFFLFHQFSFDETFSSFCTDEPEDEGLLGLVCDGFCSAFGLLEGDLFSPREASFSEGDSADGEDDEKEPPRLLGKVHALRFRSNSGEDLTVSLQGANALRVPLRVSIPIPEVPEELSSSGGSDRRKRAVGGGVDDYVMVVSSSCLPVHTFSELPTGTCCSS